MYSEEQTDQNPASATTQEEKPKKTDEMKAESKISKQITEQDQAEITGMLKGEQKTEEVAKEVPENKKETVAQQIDETEKAAISRLLKAETAEPEVAAEVKTEEAPAEDSSKQISDIEKKEIILLLHDGKLPDTAAAEHIEVEIDYEELNKQELVEILEDVVEERDITKIKSKIAKIKTAFHHRNKDEIDAARKAFIAGGGNPEEFTHSEDPLEQRFNAAFGRYRHNKARYAEDLEKQKQENLQVKYKILDELKELINSEETLKKTYDEFRKLQDRWKEVGMVPASELNNLWQNYHFLVEMFFDKVRINKELRDLDLKRNLEKKIELCEKTEELLLEKSLIKSFKELQKYHDEWREIGPVPVDKKDELWDRFKAATGKINERRKEYYGNIQAEQERNYEAKIALCEKAEEIEINPEDSLKDWQKKTDQINEPFQSLENNRTGT